MPTTANALAKAAGGIGTVTNRVPARQAAPARSPAPKAEMTADEVREALAAMDEEERAGLLAEFMEDEKPDENGEEPASAGGGGEEPDPPASETEEEDKPVSAVAALDLIGDAAPTAQAMAMAIEAERGRWTRGQVRAAVKGYAAGAAARGGVDVVGDLAEPAAPVATGATQTPANADAYTAEVKRVQREEGLSYARAAAKVNQSRPDLRAKYVEAQERAARSRR